MIPAGFGYVRATSVDDAVAALVAHGDAAKVLAGGHSLLPLMKLRLAMPAVVVDIGPLHELAHVTDRGDHVAVGALTTHRAVERSDLLARHVPLLAHVAHLVGDPQVRNRGTLGGSLSHGDPASDLPAVALATGATMVVQGQAGRREIAAADFFAGFLETALAPDELLVEVRFPKQDGNGWAYEKFNRRAMDWAIVGVAVQLGPNPGVALVNMDIQPHLSVAAGAALATGASAADVAAVATRDASPSADVHASVAYRHHLARVLTERALVAAGR